MELRSMFIDFNSYFASVEQQDDPDLRGRPVGVVPVMADGTCCIAASYEAKRHGVKTGTLVRDARRLCPGIRLVQARPAVYVRHHHALKALIERHIPIAHVGSIDEMACELLGRERKREHAVAIAHALKADLATEFPAITASIGIAPNAFLAKTATDMQKPDGLVVLEPGDLPWALYRLDLRDLCGIGPAMEKRLHRAGIRSVEQLCSAPADVLRRAWGSVEGERFHRRLRGEWLPEPSPHGASSISHSHVLPPELRHAAGAETVLKKLLQKAAVRMRGQKLVARRLQAKIKYLDAPRWKESAFCHDCDDTRTLLGHLDELLAHRPRHGRPLAVSVVLWDLCERSGTTDDLFAAAEQDAHAPLDGVLDRINERFGAQKIGYASARTPAAPMRIAFNRIPDVDREDPTARKP